MAPRCSSPGSKGFTLVELIVVITIMVAMMALAASMLRGGGRGQGLQAAVEMVDGMVQEARLDAMGTVPGGGSPEDFNRFIDAETAKWAKVIKAAGVTADG